MANYEQLLVLLGVLSDAISSRLPTIICFCRASIVSPCHLGRRKFRSTTLDLSKPPSLFCSERLMCRPTSPVYQVQFLVLARELTCRRLYYPRLLAIIGDLLKLFQSADDDSRPV
ncbi:hypothetical protein L208DRAFT_1413761 [Tricholoma matsutake]|nr:hypothetical protein L208DRAFT_1413761 [Tricholoma matsutake 945]